MKGLNLLPDELQKKSFRKVSLKFKTYSFLVVIVFGITLTIIFHVQTLKAELSKLEIENMQLQSQEIELKKIQEKIINLQENLNELNNVKRKFWGNKLAALEKVIPNEVNLTLLSLNLDGLILEGYVEEISWVGGFINNLANLDYIESVTLKNIKRKEDGGFYDFMIICKIKQE